MSRTFVAVALLAALLAAAQGRTLLAEAPALGPAPEPAPSGGAIGGAEAPAPATPVTGTYTLADVAVHNTVDSAWIVVDGQVYDVTAWLPQHPGGVARLLAHAGTDATMAFMQQHAADAQPKVYLSNYWIGTLVA